MIVECHLNVNTLESISVGFSADEMYFSIHQDGHSSVPNMSVNSPSFVQQQQRQVVDLGNHQIQPNDDQVSSIKLYAISYGGPWL